MPSEPCWSPPTWDSVESFVNHNVTDLRKRHSIRKILISTNGIAAVKCMASMRRLLMELFGTVESIKFICMTTEQEIRSNAEYLNDADGYVLSPSGANKTNYANVEEIVSHAVEQCVDAVWAGWGHASENPALPRRLAEEGIIFMGPSSDTMSLLGDKISSSIIAQSLGISTIAWSGRNLKIGLDGSDGNIRLSEDLFVKACVSNSTEGLHAVEKHNIGYPLMIKASEGGGGKGIRKVACQKDFHNAFAAVRAEVPGSPIFLMRCVEKARHIEVQLIADRYGTVIPVLTRDCSMQRRCQKVIEEAPAVIASEEVLLSMQMDAVKIAQFVGYESAGTVEFIYLPEEQCYFFLELNPRLQVEHPCTEMITNINIPGVQLQIAMGLPLRRILDIRHFYGFRGKELYEDSPLPDGPRKCPLDRHCIAVRITSENPNDYFRPSTGSLKTLNFKSFQDVWGYFSVTGSGGIHEFADSQFGHVFAVGRDRSEAIARMKLTLQKLKIQATFSTQISYIQDILGEVDFVENKFSTQWLDSRISAGYKEDNAWRMDELIAITGAMIGRARIIYNFKEFKSALERGQITHADVLTESVSFDLVRDMSLYVLTVTRSGPTTFYISLNDSTTKVVIEQLGDDERNDMMVSYNGQKRIGSFKETADHFVVEIDGKRTMFEKENDPTLLKSPYTGKLLCYKKANGIHVNKGEVFASIESMKLVFDVEVKKVSGRLEHVLREGDLLHPGTVIGSVKHADASFRPQPFKANFEQWKSVVTEETNRCTLKRYITCLEAWRAYLDGSFPPDSEYLPDAAVDELFGHLKDKSLGLLLLKSTLEGFAWINDATLSTFVLQCHEIVKCSGSDVFHQIKNLMEETVMNLSHASLEASRPIYSRLSEVCNKFLLGTDSHLPYVVNSLLTQYFLCEQFFEGRGYDDAVSALMQQFSSDNEKIVKLIYSHTQLSKKNGLIISLLERIARESSHLVGLLFPIFAILKVPTFSALFRQIGNLFHVGRVAELCRRLLLHHTEPPTQIDPLEKKKLEMWRIAESVVSVGNKPHVFKMDDEKEKRYSRLFVRETVNLPEQWEDIEENMKIHLDNACGAISIARTLFVTNHVFFFLNFSTNFTVDDELDELIVSCIKKDRAILAKHYVTEVEIVFSSGYDSDAKTRIIYRDEFGMAPQYGVYEENEGKIQSRRCSSELYGNILEKYDSIRKLDKKRAITRNVGSTYVYDYPNLFGLATIEEWKMFFDHTRNDYLLFERMKSKLTWRQRAALDSNDYHQFYTAKELVLQDGLLVDISDKAILAQRAENGSNDNGIVVWEIRLFTPERPEGLDIVLIANDFTYQCGSFSTYEDELFKRASEYSRKKGIPRVNISCNSGARIGLSEDVSKVFKIRFKNSEKPEEGFDYLYVDGDDENIRGQIDAEKLPNGTLRLKAIIGREDEKIGVENLQGSGLIAGETSLAYDEIPTYCMVTGRSVGIGAYTARLAHRVVQVKNSHIILTGATALNTLLGKDVYSSNNQLGGTHIMQTNGISHSVVENDLEGIRKIVKWMGYLPKKTNEFPFVQKCGWDLEPRPVHFAMEPGKVYDIRDLIDSKDSEKYEGICDRHSFDEIMDEWAKTIVAGRARLCGIPIGIVASELRTVESVIPADPASPDGQQTRLQQAGQVWYPDSAFKTAEVIHDFNREGLPLLFIASLRGFSGGQKDMFNMVLKFGAQIVDALRQYTQPVIIYIPKYGELRGGAWAVLDSQINPGFISMVADEESRGGILEPNAVVGIKFREDRILALQKRNDELLQRLEKELKEEIRVNGADSETAKKLSYHLEKRSEDNLNVYRRAATEFADLHDRASRMYKKGAVQHTTFLKDSRILFSQIFTIEMAKIHLSGQFAPRSEMRTHGSAYQWVEDRLKSLHPGATSLCLSEQITLLEQLTMDGRFTDMNNDIVREFTRNIASLTKEETSRIIEILIAHKDAS